MVVRFNGVGRYNLLIDIACARTDDTSHTGEYNQASENLTLSIVFYNGSPQNALSQ